MCLAVPGRIIELRQAGENLPIGRSAIVDFGGSTLEVGLDLLPDAGKDDWVLVHAGYAIQQLDEAEAREIWEYLKEMDEDMPEGIAP
mgnify:CR=1 FL=1